MIIWQSIITDEHVTHISPAAWDEMVEELNDAVAMIVESYGLEFPA
jgi:hypothetical protein